MQVRRTRPTGADARAYAQVRPLLHELVYSEQAQDLLEYTLLLAVIVLVAAGAVMAVGQYTTGLFAIANSRLVSASQ